MPIQPTYPGVYVEEVPSGVRTIVGVATSIALFIGRAARGPLNEPVLCLNPSDFERVFSNDTTHGDLPRAIRLFFQNGGTQCYVVRVAEGAASSSVTLRNEAAAPVNVLTISAKAAGVIGDTIRVAITYGGQHPESTFNLEVFRWETNSAGQPVKTDLETWNGLSMDPASPYYAPAYVSQNSQLINVVDLNAGVAPGDQSTSLSGRYISVADSVAEWTGILQTGIDSIRLLAPWNGSSVISTTRPANGIGSLTFPSPLTGTSTVSSAGNYTGSTHRSVTFTVAGTGGPFDVETDAFELSWTDGAQEGSIAFDGYTAGTNVPVPDLSGFQISLTAGTLVLDESFTIQLHPAAYSGNTAKVFTFTVDGTNGNDLTIGDPAPITINWSDGINTGSIVLDDTITPTTSIPVRDGLQLSFGAGTLREGESFSVFVHPPAFRMRMSIDGGRSWTDISLQNEVDPTNVVPTLQIVINNALGVDQVTVRLEPAVGATRQRLQFQAFSPEIGDIRIEAAVSNDLARILMLGSAQGGTEVSRFASRRPAATGHVLHLDNWDTFAELDQTDFDRITIGGETIELGTSLRTLHLSTASLMFQDALNPVSPSGGYDGVREKLAIIANSINSHRIANPAFGWAAQLVGQRLLLTALGGADNGTATLMTSNSGGGGTNISTYFRQNVRYYSLGPNGTGAYQGPGTAGNDGNAPNLATFQAAFEAVEREVDLFNLMILPRDAEHDAATIASIWGPASIFCQQQRAFLLMDPPDSWGNVQQATDPTTGVNSLRIGLVKDHSAIYYPNVIIRENGLNRPIGPSGAIAGLMSRIDSNRGVWKAPAGTEADLRDVVGLEHRFSDRENGVLNPEGINTLRIFPNGIVSWGARTMDGDDDFASEWKYVPIRRLALFIEESLYRGLQWVVFEPNDEPLWSQIRLNAGAFMNNLFRQGAFQGQKRSDAYFVKCDSETTTQNDINLGIVNVWIGFAPLKPAEFVIIKLQQIAGQIET